MASPTFQLPTRGVNMQWVLELELLEARVYPLPGGSVRRQTLDVDSRLKVQDSKSTDVITFYEHVVSVRHKPTGKIYVAFRETMDALLARQADPEKFPRWLMVNSVKQTELHIHLLEAKANPTPIAKVKGLSEVWFQQWLREIPSDEAGDSIHQSLSYFLISNKLVREEMFVRG